MARFANGTGRSGGRNKASTPGKGPGGRKSSDRTTRTQVTPARSYGSTSTRKPGTGRSGGALGGSSKINAAVAKVEAQKKRAEVEAQKKRAEVETARKRTEVKAARKRAQY